MVATTRPSPYPRRRLNITAVAMTAIISAAVLLLCVGMTILAAVQPDAASVITINLGA